MKRARYWILNDDNPTTLWKQEKESSQVDLYSMTLAGMLWTSPVIMNRYNMDEDEAAREISKREAKRLFPKAFV